eukprot:180558-Pleurochrysis_carterae.AAC.2
MSRTCVGRAAPRRSQRVSAARLSDTSTVDAQRLEDPQTRSRASGFILQRDKTNTSGLGRASWHPEDGEAGATTPMQRESRVVRRRQNEDVRKAPETRLA